MTDQPWFTARCVFDCGVSRYNPPRIRYEERIVLVHAASFDEAMAKARREAAEYASRTGFTLVDDFVSCFQTFLTEPPGDLSEIFSLMRDWDLPGDEYVDEFFATGWETDCEPPNSDSPA